MRRRRREEESLSRKLKENLFMKSKLKYLNKYIK